MKTIFIAAALAVLSAGSAMAQDAVQGVPPQGEPATNVPVLDGVQAAPDCGALSIPADKAFCVTAPVTSLGSVAEGYIALFQAEGWQIVLGDANYLLFARRKGEDQCEGLQMLAFYDTNLPETPPPPGYLGFGAIPTMPCAERAADAALVQ